jgi:O-antigen ligase
VDSPSLTGVFLILAVIIPQFSPSFEDGVSNANSDLRAYAIGNANTPIGMRLAWHKSSTKLILENPVFGHGTGSFKTEYENFRSQNSMRLCQITHTMTICY